MKYVNLFIYWVKTFPDAEEEVVSQSPSFLVNRCKTAWCKVQLSTSKEQYALDHNFYLRLRIYFLIVWLRIEVIIILKMKFTMLLEILLSFIFILRLEFSDILVLTIDSITLRHCSLIQHFLQYNRPPYISNGGFPSKLYNKINVRRN